MRLTDKRFLSDGFYEPKSKEERLEIYFMDKPSYRDIYKKLGEYENTNLEPSDIGDLMVFTFGGFANRILYGTEILIYEDFKEPANVIWTGFWDRSTVRIENKILQPIWNAEVTSISVQGNSIQIGICRNSK